MTEALAAAAQAPLYLLYRGPLASCNYGCSYCPFAKRRDDRAALARDRAALQRFVTWAGEQHVLRRAIGILFTPWGEALIRKAYRDAMIALSHLPHIAKVAVQTNASCAFDWTEDADKAKLAFWTTFHPGEISRDRFLAKTRAMDELGLRYSVGVVGLKEHADDIAWLRARLTPETYLWINAYKRLPAYYTEAEISQFQAIDPLFGYNLTAHHSLGAECRAGFSSVTVDGEGTLRRCHFIATPIGNIYEGGIEASLARRTCVNDTCGCHIGYVNLDRLGLAEIFGAGLLERIPEGRSLRA